MTTPKGDADEIPEKYQVGDEVLRNRIRWANSKEDRWISREVWQQQLLGKGRHTPTREERRNDKAYLDRDLERRRRRVLSQFIKLLTLCALIFLPLLMFVNSVFPMTTTYISTKQPLTSLIICLYTLALIGPLIADGRLRSWSQQKVLDLGGVLSMFWLGERRLAQGMTRVRWRCRCGRNMYDDYTELRSGAAAELEKWLNNSTRKHAGSISSNSQQTSILRSAASSIEGSSADQQTAENDISLHSLASRADTLLGFDGNSATALDVHLEKCWLLVCGKSKRGPDSLLKQLDLSHTPSDIELFSGMKELYSNLKSAWGLRPFLRGVKTIRFVQFQLHKSARVDIRKAPDMPPETRRDEYLYKPSDLVPPVGEALMTHWFHHPEEAWELLYAYSLIPKKRKGELEVNLSQGPRVGWGIQIVEGWLGSRLWLLGLCVFVCGSLAFAVCWTVLEHDVQGAFGVSAYIVALLAHAVGAAQANIG